MQQQTALLDKYRKTQIGRGWHTAPDDGYLYDHLLDHLKEAGLTDEIKSLFVDHNWLKARAKQSGYNAYLRDMEIAWEISQAEALKQIEMNEEPVGLVECFRYVLIQITLASIAENQVAELVARAVETNLWTPTQALSLAALVPQDPRQAEMYTKILQTGKLDEQTVKNVRQIATDIVQSIEYPWYRLRALTELAPHLEKTSQKHILGLAVELALEQADNTTYPDNHAFWWLAEQLEGDLLEQARVGALAIGNPISRVWSLTRLARLLDEPYRQNALEQAVIAAESITDELQRANALAQLAVQVTGSLAEQVLDLTLKIKDQRWHGRVLEDLVFKLNEEQLTRVLDATLKIEDFFSRWQILENIATLATGETRTRAIDALPDYKKEKNNPLESSEKTDSDYRSIKSDMKWVITVEDDEDFYEWLRPLIQRMSDAWLPKVLKRAHRIEQQVSRDLVFGALAPRLSGNLLINALKAPLTVEDRISFVRVLSSLSHQASRPVKRKVQSAILKTILAIHTPWMRIEPLIEFIPLFEGKAKARAIEQALEDIEHLANEEFRARMLASIIAFLPEEQRQEMLTSALNFTWSYKTTSEILSAAGIPDSGISVGNVKREDMEIWGRIRILSLVIDQLSEPVRTETLSRALDLASSIESEMWRSSTLQELAHHLKGDALERELDVVIAIPSERERIEGINAFIPYLPPSSLLRILNITSQIEHIGCRATTLINLAKQLDEEKQQILAAVFALAMQEKDIWTKINHLVEIAKLGMQKAAQEGIKTAQLLTDEWERAQALAMFVPLLGTPDDMLKQIRLGLLSHFQVWRVQKREMLFHDLVDEDIFTPPILSTQILSAFAASVVQIHQHWDWT